MSSNVIALPEWMRPEVDGYDGWGDEDVPEIPSYSFYGGRHKLFFDAGPHVYYRYDAEGNRVDVAGVTTVLDVINKPFLKAWAAKVAIEFVKDSMMMPDGSFKTFSTEEFMAMLHEAKGQHKVHLDKAGDIGHIAHNILEDSIKFAIAHTDGIILELKNLPTEDIPANKMAITCANHALQWCRDHNVRWLATERKVYSEEFDVAGTMDGLCIVDSCSNPECKGCQGRVFKDRKAVADWKSSNQLADSYAYQTCSYLFAQIEEFGEYIGDRWVLRLGKTEGDFEPWYLPAEYFEADLEAFLAALQLYRSLKEITERRQEDGRKFRAIVNERKRIAREARKAQEKADKFAAKLERMRLTKERKEASAALYKSLRDQGLSVLEAKAQVAIEFPPKAAKEEPEDESDVEIEVNEVEVEVEAKVAHSVQPAELPEGVEYVVKL